MIRPTMRWILGSTERGWTAVIDSRTMTATFEDGFSVDVEMFDEDGEPAFEEDEFFVAALNMPGDIGIAVDLHGLRSITEDPDDGDAEEAG